MVNLLFNRWVGLGVAVVITAVVFTVIGTLIDSGGADGPLVGPVTFATGGAVPSRGEGERDVALGDTTVFNLPLTAVDAVEAGTFRRALRVRTSPISSCTTARMIS